MARGRHRNSVNLYRKLREHPFKPFRIRMVISDKDLNAHVEAFNADKPKTDQVDAFAAADLKKLAFWNATGSGKTLLMHVNILQYRHYLEQHGRGNELNRTILLTPNEGLSNQHLEEFAASGIQAEIFSKEGRGLFAGRSIEIIEVTKLKEQTGDKTVAIGGSAQGA